MKTIRPIVCIAFLLALLLTATAQAAGLSREKAFDIIYQTILERTGIKQDELVIEKEERDPWGDGFWYVELRQKAYEGTTGLIKIQINPTGGVAGFKGPVPTWQADLEAQVDKTARLLRNNRAGFSIQDMAHLYQEMAPFMASLERFREEQQAKDRKLSGMMQAMFAFKQPMGLPGPEAVLEEAALKAARAAILNMEEWTQERLDKFPLFISVYYQSQQQGKAIYQFIFSRQGTQPPGDAGETAWEAYEKGYLKDLAALYGGDEMKAPRFVSVKLDAGTGEPVEAPYTSYYGPGYEGDLETIR